MNLPCWKPTNKRNRQIHSYKKEKPVYSRLPELNKVEETIDCSLCKDSDVSNRFFDKQEFVGESKKPNPQIEINNPAPCSNSAS
ncbi:hypothetical protein Xhom_04450 [Xenorhabdus hominickii]|uniref:Uncharacterized protein n=1 Tax=Xenorhabdus hominickii TaxID=351679 RepID=A0A1V0M467_XENHO|nr:hypothetical protein [Xenorhabdus hominickii]PHM52372.1 hypothetical protein Xhom_04450 [Xenorhabdus hominickii]